MRKLGMISLIVPIAMLIAFGTVSFADTAKTELNSELNGDLNDNGSASVRGDQDRSDLDGTDLQGDSELNAGTEADASRGERALGQRRGRQARRGQTTIQLIGSQADEGGDSKSGKSADEDEDEDGETVVTN